MCVGGGGGLRGEREGRDEDKGHLSNDTCSQHQRPIIGACWQNVATFTVLRKSDLVLRTLRDGVWQ